MGPMSMNRDAQTALGRRTPLALLAAAIGFAYLILAGCSSAPSTTQTGFLSSYAELTPAGPNRMRYTSPELGDYTAFIIDPVQVSSQPGKLEPEQRAEVANHFRRSLTSELTKRGYTVTETPGVRTARIRVAITNINDSVWWQKVHPASSLAGAGRGGAAMEGEIIDSITGDQLAGVVQSGVGSQFTLGNFSTISDINNVVDQWVLNACDRLDELRASRR